jgi:hypothetical protein
VPVVVLVCDGDGVPLQMQKGAPLPAAPHDTKQHSAAHGDFDGVTDGDGAVLALTDEDTDGVAVTAAVPVGVLVTTPVPEGDRLALGDRHSQVMSG